MIGRAGRRRGVSSRRPAGPVPGHQPLPGTDAALPPDTGLINVGYRRHEALRLPGGSRTESYWITGVTAERRFGAARLFLDTKQSDYAPVVLGTRSNPGFAEVWAPMDGFVVNGGVKYTF